MRILPVCLLALACAAPETGERAYPVAIQVPGGIGFLHDGLAGPPVPGSEGAQTFCWDRQGHGFYLTAGGTLKWIPTEGGEPRTLVDGFKALRFPDVSDQGVIAFGATREDGAGEGWQIWLVNEDGSGLRQITEGYDPSWSPDGFYFERYEPETGIYFYDLANASARPVLPPGSRDYTVECSPSGRYLAFSREGALILHDVAGDSTRPLTDGSTYDCFASFSPDERELVFYREANGRNWLVHCEIATGREQVFPMTLQVTPAYPPPPER